MQFQQHSPTVYQHGRGLDVGVVKPKQTKSSPTSKSSYSPKLCSVCGTSRTPQWREGPEGPKTLCNACGVKRVRQMRLAEDGKHREAGDGNAGDLSPAQLAAHQAAHQAATRAPAAYDLLKQVVQADEPEPYKCESGSGHNHEMMQPESSEGRQAESPLHHEHKPTGSGNSPTKRPIRKAAARAATRTAEFATTGDWPEEEEDAMSPAKHRAARQDSGSSGSDLSQAAEEVAFHQGPRFEVPTSPMQAVGQECAAAVNLLSMSVKETDIINSRRASTAAAAATPRRTATSHGNQGGTKARGVTSNAGPRAAKLSSSYGTRSSERPAQMQALEKELHAALQEAASADAVVAAVAQILAIKQAAATRANAAVEAVNRQIRDLEADWQGPSKKRQRRSL